MGEYIFSAKKGGLSSRYVLKNPHSQDITIEQDFFYSKLLKILITDTHFSERGREGRLLGFMFRAQYDYDARKMYGLGIDEKSSLTLDLEGMMAEGGVWLYKSLEINPSYQLGDLDYRFKKKQLSNSVKLPHFSHY